MHILHCSPLSAALPEGPSQAWMHTSLTGTHPHTHTQRHMSLGTPPSPHVHSLPSDTPSKGRIQVLSPRKCTFRTDVSNHTPISASQLFLHAPPHLRTQPEACFHTSNVCAPLIVTSTCAHTRHTQPQQPMPAVCTLLHVHRL